MHQLRAFWNRLSKIISGKAAAWVALAAATALLAATVSPGLAMESSAQLVPISADEQLAQGRAAYESGQLTAAAQHWQSAAAHYADTSDKAHQALSLSYLSLAYQALGKWPAATQAIQVSLALAVEDTAVLAPMLNTYGHLQLGLGQIEQSIDTWAEAADYYDQLGDTLGRLGSQLNQAQAMQTLGLYRQAQGLLETTYESLESKPNSLLKAAALRSLGTALQTVGDLSLSKQLLSQSVAIAQQLAQPSEVAKSQLALANTLRALQETAPAITAYEQAMASPGPDRLAAQLNLLSYWVELSRWQPALALALEVRSQLQSLQPSRASIYSRVNFAESVLQLPQAGSEVLSLAELAQLLAVGVEQAKTLRDVRAESYALGQLGALYWQTRQWQDAQTLTQQAAKLAKAIRADDIAYRWQWQLGRIFQARAQPAAAISAYTEAVTSLRAVRKDLLATRSDVQFSFKEKVEPLYRELIGLLLAEDESRLASLEQARSLIEDLQLAELENYFRSACIDASSTQVDQIDPTAAVLYPIILPDRLEVLLSLPGQPLQHYRTQLPQAEVEKTVDQFFVYFNPALSDQQRLQQAQTIYDWLIRPAQAQLQQQQIKTLVFVLDSALRNIPMAALHDGQRYLIETYAVALTPGLQLLGPHFTKPQPLAALVLGISESRAGFAALPGVKAETQEILTNTQQAQLYLNQDFTKQRFEAQIKATSYPILHLATHGQFSSALTETFLLAWDQKITLSELDSLLQARQAESARPIELMVLSACQTAAGDKRAMLGLAGMAVQSGARSTLATLWSVNDRSTVELMTHFYQSVGQTTKAEALRQAQLALLKDRPYSHPFYWAPFVLVGNWLI
ncbi:MAG: CHAT domain-containing protein [Leptolyngbya sp. SIO4C1]|nr:CHAT domain-containing protein [Leptolyngbya sp. SIO4C1]